ncbi:TolC family protein [Marinicella gelatinilytica]|uniref:TolC family protein n=1 Tax=Marinicella gelatinilytica TaxID=2996017 RepID=UPI0022608937|nr:TolC family protein [Marinicella gelatinilytica]MCX7543879.1 TolC family protein [Marinicella gelatinilytica]
MINVQKNSLIDIKKWRQVCFCLLMVSGMLSNPLSAKEMSLTTAIRNMSAYNPSLKIFDLKQQGLDGAQITAGLNPEYKLGIEAENFTGSQPYTSFEQTELSISLSSVIELGDKKEARTNFVLTKYERLKAQRKLKSLGLIAELTTLYIDMLATQERIKLAQQSVQLSEDIYASVQRKANVGAISDIEVKRALAALKRAELTLRAEHAEFDKQRVELSLFWSEKNPDFDQITGQLYDFGIVKEIDVLYDHADESTVIQLITMNQQLAESKLKVIEAESKTDINWSLGVKRFEQTNDAALTAGISIPLFKSNRNQGALIEAEADIDSIQSQQQMTLLELYGQINEFYSLRTTAIDRFNTLQNDIIPALTEALDMTREAYLEGRYGYLAYSTARTELIQSKKSLIDTAQSILKYGVQLERIMAMPIYKDTPQNPQNQGDDS